MQPRTVQTAGAPAAIGPYSQAVIAGNMVYTAGQIGLDPRTMQVVGDGIEEQTIRVLESLRAILESAGASLETVVKTTVYLTDMNDFAAMNEVYAQHFGTHKPARSTVEAARLPKDVRVEIEAVALLR